VLAKDDSVVRLPSIHDDRCGMDGSSEDGASEHVQGACEDDGAYCGTFANDGCTEEEVVVMVSLHSSWTPS